MKEYRKIEDANELIEELMNLVYAIEYIFEEEQYFGQSMRERTVLRCALSGMHCCIRLTGADFPRNVWRLLMDNIDNNFGDPVPPVQGAKYYEFARHRKGVLS